MSDQNQNMFEVVGEGYYDAAEDKLFLPDVDPEDWEATTDAEYAEEQYDDGYDILSSLESLYGRSVPPVYGPTHMDPYWEEQ